MAYTFNDKIQGEMPYDESSLKNVLHNAGIFEPDELETTRKFSMFGFFNPSERLGPTFEYTFFTKPDLFLFNGDLNTDNLTFKTREMISAVDTHPEVLRQLQLKLNPDQPLSALLYNYRVSNMEIPDLEAGDMETATNMWGQKLFYRRSSSPSNVDYNFSMEFKDNKYLDVFTFFKLYDHYEEQKAYGTIPMNYSDYYKHNYIYERRLHDQMAVFKFIVGEDGSEIIYYAKAYGVYPKNVPNSVFGDLPEDGNLKFTVNFKANFVEDYNPLILGDFNELSELHKPINEVKGLYNPAGYVRNDFAYPPFISYKVVNNRLRYFLKWRD